MKERKKVKLLNRVRLFTTPWTVAYQAPPSMGFSRQEYLPGLPFPFPGNLPNPGMKPGSPTLQADALPSEPPGVSGSKIPLLCSVHQPSNDGSEALAGVGGVAEGGAPPMYHVSLASWWCLPAGHLRGAGVVGQKQGREASKLGPSPAVPDLGLRDPLVSEPAPVQDSDRMPRGAAEQGSHGHHLAPPPSLPGLGSDFLVGLLLQNKGNQS